MTPLTKRYLTELSERTEEVRELRERLDDALDSREQAELRAEQAEALLEKARAWATSLGLADELDLTLARWRPHCRREPLSPHRERRIEECRQKLQALHMRLEEAIEANHRMARIADRDRLRAETAERECDELRAEDRSLRYRKVRP